MTKLSNYLQDGANYQARGVLMFLQNIHVNNDNDNNVEVARWENCREQGYIVSLRNDDYTRQINIAFFEHRNSDDICAVKWEQISMNSLTIDSAEFGDVYTTKHDVSHSVSWGEVKRMSDWIGNELEKFWEVAKKEEKVK
jgi:hypothetical protein